MKVHHHQNLRERSGHQDYAGKTELFWSKIVHGGLRFASYEAVKLKHPLYLWVKLSSPSFMNYPG